MNKRSLKSIRADLNYNQEQMAKALNMALSTYKLKECGKSPLLARELYDISKIGNVEITDIEIKN